MKKTILLSFSIVLLIFLLSCQNKESKGPDVKKKETDNVTRIKPQTSLNPYSAVDVSPMDMSYFPAEYAKMKMAKTISTPPLARVIYSRPHLEGRHIFKEVLKYGEPWRLGANEATELELFTDVTIERTKIKKGRYSIYCIPQPDKWEIIINTTTDTWGLQPDSSKDLAAFEVPVKQTDNQVEYFTIVFEKIESGANLLMAWDNIEVRLPLTF
jgi:hypothetical protein